MREKEHLLRGIVERAFMGEVQGWREKLGISKEGREMEVVRVAVRMYKMSLAVAGRFA